MTRLNGEYVDQDEALKVFFKLLHALKDHDFYEPSPKRRVSLANETTALVFMDRANRRHSFSVRCRMVEYEGQFWVVTIHHDVIRYDASEPEYIDERIKVLEALSKAVKSINA